MRTLILLTIISGMLFYSCSPKQDKLSQLEELRKQREDIDKKIEQLEQEIGSDSNLNIQSGKAVLIETESVRPELFKHYIEIQGSIESDNNIFIPPQSPGIVKKIYVEEGDKVAKGQLLAELDASIYDKGIEELKNGLELAKTVFERQERLWKQKIGSEIQYLQAKSQKEALEKKMATLLEQKELTKIKSPISGTIDEITIKEGEGAAAGFGAIRVVQLSALKVKAQLSESYINDVEKGDTVIVHIPSINNTFNKRIDVVSKVINPDNRTFSIELKIPANTENVRPNMLSVLKINDYTSEKAITVPVNIVQKTDNESFLFIAEKNNEGKLIAKRRTVKSGKYSRNKLEILEGLKEGEMIITIGYQDLADGQEVKVNK